MSTPPEGRPTRNRTESLLLAPPGARRWHDWLALALVVFAFAFVDPVLGTVAGLVTAAVWVGLGTPYALAAGVLFAVALTPDGADPFTVTLVGGSLIALLVAPVLSAEQPLAYATAAVLGLALLGGLTWLLVTTQTLWLAAALPVGVGLVVLSLLSRYTRLQLGLLDDAADSEPASGLHSDSREGDRL